VTRETDVIWKLGENQNPLILCLVILTEIHLNKNVLLLFYLLDKNSRNFMEKREGERMKSFRAREIAMSNK